MAEADLATPSVTPAPVGTDVPIPTDLSSERATDVATLPVSAAKPTMDLGHPFVKLAALGGALLGLCGLATLQRAPADVPALASSGRTAASAPMAVATSSAATRDAADAGDVATATDRVPHDVDDEEQPPPHANPSRATRRHPTTHSPDAKAGVTTGYRDGEPVRVTLTIIDGKPVEEHTAAQFRKMRAAAERAGVSLQVVSGFRTMERQRELYDDYRAGRGHLAAIPGHSNHQSGHALDLAVGAPKVRAWLDTHATEFGFRRAVPNEPWHWEN